MKFKYTQRIKFFLLILLISNLAFSQKGKHGNLTVVSTNTRVNEFTTLTSNVSTGDATISVASSALNTNSRFTSTLQVGDLIMIIQMQGAIIKTFAAVLGQDSTYGEILNYNNAGNYEFAQVYAIPNATSIVLDCGLKNNYLVSGKTQIVRVPRYNTLTVNAAGELTTDAWNGTIAGVLAVEVNGLTTINGTVNATGLGFRGGIASNNGTFGGNRFVDVGGGANEGGFKGEGIAGSVADYSISFNGSWAMGAPANGGGGGDSHNAGGGGGANGGNINTWVGYGTVNPVYSAGYNMEFAGRASIVSSGGGRGGYTFSSANLNPLVSVPHNTVWGGDNRRKVGGFGGRPLDYSTGRIFLGGGGGAGHCNNLSASNTGGTGGNGGGLIFMQVYNNITGTGTIVANGSNGATSTGPYPGNFSNNVNGNDSGGGGGGGGTIMLASTGNASGVVVNANGGGGGNQLLVKGGLAGSNTEAEGPGGGGGGGYIAYSNTAPAAQNVLGAVSGTTNSQPFVNFPPNGATNGADGLKDQNIKLYEITTSNVTVCLNSAATLTVTTNTPLPNFFWYNSLTGPSQIGTGTAFTTSVFITAGTYTVYAGVCPGTYREPVVITVVATPTVAATSASICGTQTVILTGSGATSYTWSSGPTTSTIAVSPTATTIYTVIGSVAGCTSQATSTVALQGLPSVTVIPSSTIICANQTITLNASGSSGTYSWSTGAGNTSSIGIITSGVYTTTLTNSCGTAVYSVNIIEGPSSIPVLSASANTICAGGSVTLTASGTGTFAWSTTTVNTSSVTVGSSGIYAVTLTNACGSSNATIAVTNGPQPTITVVPSQSVFCTGQTATLVAMGSATSFTWVGGPTAPTFTTTFAGIYTVNASSQCGNTSAQVTVTFQVSPDISLSSSRTFLCPGDTATLKGTNLSGGGAFSWSSSSNTANIEPILSGGIYTVSYINGCGAATATISVVQSTLIPNFVPSVTSGIVPLTVSFTNTSFNNMINQWTYGNGLLSNGINGSSTYSLPGIYTVTLIIQNSEGCLAATTRTIEVVNVPFGIIPQLVSPNNDGKNETFEVKGIEQFTNSELQIFNRWGNKVYSMKNYDNSFDGTPNYKSISGKLPAGTYFFILSLGNSENKTYNGYFQLAY
jgi:gliding motility-associated-like protein